jgi:hypothetical protein
MLPSGTFEVVLKTSDVTTEAMGVTVLPSREIHRPRAFTLPPPETNISPLDTQSAVFGAQFAAFDTPTVSQSVRPRGQALAETSPAAESLSAADQQHERPAQQHERPAQQHEQPVQHNREQLREQLREQESDVAAGGEQARSSVTRVFGDGADGDFAAEFAQGRAGRSAIPSRFAQEPIHQRQTLQTAQTTGLASNTGLASAIDFAPNVDSKTAADIAPSATFSPNADFVSDADTETATDIVSNADTKTVSRSSTEKNPLQVPTAVDASADSRSAEMNGGTAFGPAFSSLFGDEPQPLPASQEAHLTGVRRSHGGTGQRVLLPDDALDVKDISDELGGPTPESGGLFGHTDALAALRVRPQADKAARASSRAVLDSSQTPSIEPFGDSRQGARGAALTSLRSERARFESAISGAARTHERYIRYAEAKISHLAGTIRPAQTATAPSGTSGPAQKRRIRPQSDALGPSERRSPVQSSSQAPQPSVARQGGFDAYTEDRRAIDEALIRKRVAAEMHAEFSREILSNNRIQEERLRQMTEEWMDVFLNS